jgi:YHS domain-containing protein
VRKGRIVGVAWALSALVALSAEAGGWNTNESNVVLDGYDVVAYFEAGEAVHGKRELSAEHEGGTFHFSTRETLEAFQKAPTKYAPEFGGFCAFGVAVNKAKVPTDPKTFKIQDGKLLLFFNDMYEGEKVNTKLMWQENERKLYEQAVAIWPTLE